MADRKGLQIIGFILGGSTVATMLIAGFVVSAHVNGRLALEQRPVVSASLSASLSQTATR